MMRTLCVTTFIFLTVHKLKIIRKYINRLRVHHLNFFFFSFLHPAKSTFLGYIA